MIKYKPADSQASPRFCGVRTFMRLPHVQTLEDIDFAVIGVPFDTGASLKVGARFGPEAIRSSSIILKPYNMFLDVNIFEHCSGVDYGDLPVVPGYIEDSNTLIEESLSPLIENGVIPVLLGGDHSVTLPELRAIAKTHGPVALIHFDSHTDTLDEYFGRPYNHGTPFRRAVDENLLDVEHSIQVGLRGQLYQPGDLEESKRLGFETMTSVEVQDMGRERVIEKIQDRVKGAKAFVTFDIDFVDPAFAPGTGTPEVGGFTSAETLRLIRGLKGLNMVGFDVVEVLPAYDPSQITSLLAANIAYEFISLIALGKK
jgi:agmatinase